MLVPEITSSIVNSLVLDNYKRPNGVFLINKPAGVTSHDIVDSVRKILRTKRVGHAGALDPFATGLLVILVGKYTKYTEALIAQDKSYTAQVILGISTTTQDPEGDVIEKEDIQLEQLITAEQNLGQLEERLRKTFQPGYDQAVPLFSSVKIQGNKLRVLARQANQLEYLEPGKIRLYFPQPIKFNGTSNTVHDLELPKKPVKINQLNLTKIEALKSLEIMEKEVTGSFISIETEISCSKGTYIRQLAQDIGDVLGFPAFLYNLQRTSIAKFELNDALTLDALAMLASKYLPQF